MKLSRTIAAAATVTAMTWLAPVAARAGGTWYLAHPTRGMCAPLMDAARQVLAATKGDVFPPESPDKYVRFLAAEGFSNFRKKAERAGADMMVVYSATTPEGTQAVFPMFSSERFCLRVLAWKLAHP